MPTIDGGRVGVKIPAGTQTGKQMRLRGKGMSMLNAPSKGDAIIEIFVETPVSLSKKQQALMKQLDEALAGDGGKGRNKHSPESSGFLNKVKDLWDELKD